VSASRTGTTFIARPAAILAGAGRRFGFDFDEAWRCAGLALATPMFATGAAFAIDGLVQQVVFFRLSLSRPSISTSRKFPLRQRMG